MAILQVNLRCHMAGNIANNSCAVAWYGVSTSGSKSARRARCLPMMRVHETDARDVLD